MTNPDTTPAEEARTAFIDKLSEAIAHELPSHFFSDGKEEREQEWTDTLLRTGNVLRKYFDEPLDHECTPGLLAALIEARRGLFYSLIR